VNVAPDRRDIAGVPIDWLDINECLSVITSAARARHHFQVSTVNLDFLVHAQEDEVVRSILQTNALNVPDGAPVVWLGRLAGATANARVAGADLVPRLVEIAAREHLGVFLLGGEAGVAEIAADVLRKKYPGLRVDTYEPPRASLDEMDDTTILRLLDECRPHLLFVAFGHPKQEKWIARHRDRLPMAAMGVGCCLDLMAGRQSRAPVWMQKCGLEWLYRLSHEPGRLARRYATDAAWLITAVLQVLVRPGFPPPAVDGPSAGQAAMRGLPPRNCLSGEAIEGLEALTQALRS